MNPKISARTTKTAGGPRRAPRSEEEKAEYLALFERSGKSVSAFCREHGLCEQTFYYWRKRLQPAAKRHKDPQLETRTLRDRGIYRPTMTSTMTSKERVLTAVARKQ